MPLLNLYLDHLVAQADQCLEDSGVVAKIEQALPGVLPIPMDAWPEPVEALHRVHPPPAFAPGVAV